MKKMLGCKNISGSFLFLFVLLHLINIPNIVYSKMYLWKDETGVFNASEEMPGWWPQKSDCTVWVSGRKNKVVDLVKTNENMTTCELNTKEKKEKVGKSVKKSMNHESSAPQKKLIEPTDREERIYCAYRKGLMRFLDVSNTEEVSAYHVSKQFGISKEEVSEINSKVLEYRGGDYQCAY